MYTTLQYNHASQKCVVPAKEFQSVFCLEKKRKARDILLILFLSLQKKKALEILRVK